MAKTVSNVLGVALALFIGIMVASAGSASSVLAVTPTGNASGNSSMKSGNMTSSGSMMNKTGSDNMSKADNAKAGNMSKAGNTTASNQLIF